MKSNSNFYIENTTWTISLIKDSSIIKICHKASGNIDLYNLHSVKLLAIKEADQSRNQGKFIINDNQHYGLFNLNDLTKLFSLIT
jgi:hypothetical protein